MTPRVYILHSNKLDRFYTGSTELSSIDRLELHLKRVYGDKKFTARADDWTLYFIIECHSIKQARKIELYIKKMKSKTYINNLKNYPEMSEKLLQKYK